MHIDKHFSNVNMPELAPGLLSICSSLSGHHKTTHNKTNI